MVRILRLTANTRWNGEIVERGAVIMASSAARIPLFNAAVLSGPVSRLDDLRAYVHAASNFLTERRLAWSFIVCRDSVAEFAIEDINRILASDGNLSLTATYPGMSAEVVLTPRCGTAPLRIRPVCDDVSRRLFADINARAYAGNPDDYRELLDNQALSSGCLRGFVAFDQGAPVATAATLPLADETGVYWVATLPESQRRGHAGQIIRHAVAEATRQSGATGSTLQATQACIKLYQELGYGAVTEFLVFQSTAA